jgi:hypothetical protein
MMRYVAGQMSDVPASGVMFLEGLTGEQYYDAMRDYKVRREMGYKGEMAIGGGSGQKISGSRVPFAVAPEGFEYSTYVEIAVNAFAAAFGIDRQDLYPLQGKMSGTATQSEVLAEKSRGMAFGDLLSKITRAINTRILPPALEFGFEYRDEEKDKQVAERTGILLSNASTLKALGEKPEIVMQYLAMQDETLRDVLMDDNGDVIALPDDDVLAQEQTETVPDADAIATDTENESNPEADSVPVTDTENQKAQKDISDTQADFMSRFSSVLESARNKDINRMRAGILIRGMIRTFGGRAFGDGLEDSGVPRNRMDSGDNLTVNNLIATQSQYVSNLTDVLFNQDGISDLEAQGKAIMWFNKSIYPFFDAGRLSGGANGMRQWMLGPTEHCADCLRLANQIHRLKEFLQSGWHPKSTRLECGGFRCECELVKRPGASVSGVLPI